MQLPAPDRPDMSDLEMLQTIEDVVLGSSDRRQAVVIGPASALVDRLVRSDAAAVRDDLLRTDRVRGVVRLPAGLLPSMTRARLALWCLGPVPDGRLDEARTVVADLADITLDDAVTGELVTDLVAGMQDARALAAHAPRFARPVLTRVLRARTGDLVEPVAAGPRSVETAELTARIAEITTSLAAPPTPPSLPTPLPRSAPPQASPRSALP